MARGAMSTIGDSVRWLIQRERNREREALRILTKKELTGKELMEKLQIKHWEQLSRILGYLEDHGLVNRSIDSRGSKPHFLYASSPLGERALWLADRADEAIKEEAMTHQHYHLLLQLFEDVLSKSQNPGKISWKLDPKSFHQLMGKEISKGMKVLGKSKDRMTLELILEEPDRPKDEKKTLKIELSSSAAT